MLSSRMITACPAVVAVTRCQYNGGLPQGWGEGVGGYGTNPREQTGVKSITFPQLRLRAVII